MVGDSDPTAALIVHKQVEFTRQFSRTRSTRFASTVADRFYSDNSLDRQRRVVECTKRRQTRAREKALEQEEELQQLQLQYEHKRRVRELQSQRETSRMTRRLQHVAAAYIQYIFRSFRQRRQRQLRRAHATRFIADFVSYKWRRHRRRRSLATRRIQRQWHEHKLWQRTMLCVKVIQKFMVAIAQKRRLRRRLAAISVQRYFRRWRARRRRAAVSCIQRAWRSHSLWRGILDLAQLSRLERLAVYQDFSARVLQRAVARFTVRRRLLRTPLFARFVELDDRRRRWWTIPDRGRSAKLWETQRRVLADALAQTKRLQLEESKLRSEFEQLVTRAKESHEKRSEEQERLRRFHAWADLRRAKEDETFCEQLREWESRKRFEIRMELERELDVERRAQLRSQQQQQHHRHANDRIRVAQDEDARIETAWSSEVSV